MTIEDFSIIHPDISPTVLDVIYVILINAPIKYEYIKPIGKK